MIHTISSEQQKDILKSDAHRLVEGPAAAHDVVYAVLRSSVRTAMVVRPKAAANGGRGVERRHGDGGGGSRKIWRPPPSPTGSRPEVSVESPRMSTFGGDQGGIGGGRQAARARTAGKKAQTPASSDAASTSSSSPSPRFPHRAGQWRRRGPKRRGNELPGDTEPASFSNEDGGGGTDRSGAATSRSATRSGRRQRGRRWRGREGTASWRHALHSASSRRSLCLARARNRVSLLRSERLNKDAVLRDTSAKFLAGTIRRGST
uniref:Uncharacterized protein n=1 Tax=Oryza glumipatula TaxID=40148 RepID=A0A0D9Z6S0_9ORYZ